jgi:hypothetical protein
MGARRRPFSPRTPDPEIVRTRKEDPKSESECQRANSLGDTREEDGIYVCLPVVLLSCQRQNRLRQLISTRRLGEYASSEHSRGTDLVLFDPIDKSRTVPSMRVRRRSPSTKNQEPPRARSKGRHRCCNRSACSLFAVDFKDACSGARREGKVRLAYR